MLQKQEQSEIFLFLQPKKKKKKSPNCTHMEICGHPTVGSQAKPEEHQLENLSVIFTGTIGLEE